MTIKNINLQLNDEETLLLGLALKNALVVLNSDNDNEEICFINRLLETIEPIIRNNIKK